MANDEILLEDGDLFLLENGDNFGMEDEVNHGVFVSGIALNEIKINGFALGGVKAAGQSSITAIYTIVASGGVKVGRPCQVTVIKPYPKGNRTGVCRALNTPTCASAPTRATLLNQVESPVLDEDRFRIEHPSEYCLPPENAAQFNDLAADGAVARYKNCNGLLARLVIKRQNGYVPNNKPTIRDRGIAKKS